MKLEYKFFLKQRHEIKKSLKSAFPYPFRVAKLVCKNSEQILMECMRNVVCFFARKV